jgi:hypothetical protein
MSVFAQLFWGSALLAVCSLVHIASMVGSELFCIRLSHRRRHLPEGIFSALLVTVAVAVLVASHTVQVWLWAFALMALGAIQGVSDGVYFALVTYTTVGYGDVVLDPQFRVFGAMAAVTGMLAFGLSTASLVATLTRHFPSARFH